MWFVCAMPCSICGRGGHNITTCPSLLFAQAKVEAKKEELAQAERELSGLERNFSQRKASNALRREAGAKNKKSDEKEEGQSKGSDTEKELFGDDPCVLDPEAKVGGCVLG